MWGLKNHTPFPAQVNAYRTHRDEAFWGVWLAARFALRPDLPPLFLGDQTTLRSEPEFNEDGSLAADADLMPHRDRIDLIIHGHAMQPAPDESGPRRVTVTLGSWSKELDVHPPLRWGFMGRATVDNEAKPSRVALDGSDSFGGEGHDANPVGRGFGLPKRLPRGQTAADIPPPPTVFPSGEAPARRSETSTACTFGPVSPLWPVRTSLSGTYDEKWETRRAPLLPEDLDPACWQSAPPDQQLERPLPAQAMIAASGFDTTGPAGNPTRLPLPTLSLRCDTRIGTRWVGAEAQLQSLTIDLDAMTVRVVHHARWPIARASADVDISQTVVELTDTDDFRVPPEFVDQFHKSPSQRQVAS